jgi:hypothetical protein
VKPLGVKNYGSIPHLSFSRLGPGDYFCSPGQEVIATQGWQANKKYQVIVTLKLDGSNVGVCCKDGKLIALSRAGYTAESSPYEQHHLFADWVNENKGRFSFLSEGERVVGEWLAQAHGTRYKLPHDPFVAFDLFKPDNKRYSYSVFKNWCQHLTTPHVLHHDVTPLSEQALKGKLTEYDLDPVHGELEPCEGAVYRVESNGQVLFLVKYVRPGKEDGKYLKEKDAQGNQINSAKEVWNWRP